MAAVITGSQNGTVGLINAGTAVASTSGTSIDFTSIPAGVKRITVMFNGVSTNGTSGILVQIGSGSVATTGYLAHACYIQASAVGSNTSTSGAIITPGLAADTLSGPMTITTSGSNIWNFAATLFRDSLTDYTIFSSATITLGGALDRVRITTVNGTDTFDAGSINILYE